MTYKELLQADLSCWVYPPISSAEEMKGKTIAEVKNIWLSSYSHLVLIFTDGTCAVHDPYIDSWGHPSPLFNCYFNERSCSGDAYLSEEGRQLASIGVLKPERLKQVEQLWADYETELSKTRITEAIDKKLAEVEELKKHLSNKA